MWAQLRQAGADRDDDNSLFRFLDEVTSIVEARLDNLECEVASVARGEYGEIPADLLGICFGPALDRLRSLYSHWTTVAGFVDNLDAEVGTPDDMATEDQILQEIEARSRRRHLTLTRPGKS